MLSHQGAYCARSGHLRLLRHALAEVAGRERRVAFRNHPCREVGNEVQAFQGHDACRHQIARREEAVLQVGRHRLLAGRDGRQVLHLYAQHDVEQQQDVEADEVEHRAVEMDGQIPCQPLRPCTFPLGQQAERPLYRSEDGKHTQQNLLAVDGRPPAYAEDDQRDEHDDLVDAHHGARRQGGEPQLRSAPLHVRYGVHSGLFHGRLDEIGVGRPRMGDISLRLQIRVERVAHMDELLHLLELVGDLCGLRLIKVMRVGAYAVGNVGEEIQKAPAAAAAHHTRICRRVPPAQDNGDGQRTEELHHIERLVLDHHLVGDACRHDDGEERRQRHAHLKDPPVTTNYFKWV